MSQYLEAFFDLTCSRLQTFGGPGRIPISEIKAYCDLIKIGEEDIGIFIKFIQKLDDAFLNHLSKTSKPIMTAKE